MPSELIVEVCTVDKINKHPNADRLEIAQVKGWQCVVQKDKFKVNDKVVYFPIDSVLTEELEDIIFGEDSKIHLKGRRIRTIKLRKVISQGLVVPISAVELDSDIKVGTDVKDVLGVTKYVQPTKNKPKSMLSEPAKKRKGNDNFSKYTKINHLSNFPWMFKDENVHIYEKIHGTNFRAGLLDKTPKTWWEKLKLFFTGKGKPEFVYGSHNVQLKNKDSNGGFYPRNVYWKTVENYNVIDKLKWMRKDFGNKDVIIYGEIYGPGIQGKKYSYGVPDGETRLVVFDIKVDGHYMDNETLNFWCDIYDFDMPYEFTPIGGALYDKELVREKGSGLSKLNHSRDPKCTPIIEGVVVRTSGTDRKIAKYVNPEYLLQKGVTEWS